MKNIVQLYCKLSLLGLGKKEYCVVFSCKKGQQTQNQNKYKYELQRSARLPFLQIAFLHVHLTISYNFVIKLRFPSLFLSCFFGGYFVFVFCFTHCLLKKICRPGTAQGTLQAYLFLNIPLVYLRPVVYCCAAADLYSYVVQVLTRSSRILLIHERRECWLAHNIDSFLGEILHF